DCFRSRSGDPRQLHSFPTRRSSDLGLEPQIVADSLLGLLYFLFERFVIQRRMTIMAMTMRLYLPPAPLHFLELSPGERPIVGRVHRTMRQTPIGQIGRASCREGEQRRVV